MHLPVETRALSTRGQRDVFNLHLPVETQALSTRGQPDGFKLHLLRPYLADLLKLLLRLRVALVLVRVPFQRELAVGGCKLILKPTA